MKERLKQGSDSSRRNLETIPCDYLIPEPKTACEDSLLQGINTGKRRHESSDDKNMTELKTSGDYQPLSALANLPLSKITPAQVESLSSHVTPTQDGLHSTPGLVSGNSFVCCDYFPPVTCNTPTGFTNGPSETLEQSNHRAFYANQNNGHYMPQSLFNLKDYPDLGSSKTSKPENGKEPIRSSTSEKSREVTSSPGKLFKDAPSPDKARKRKRAGDETTKTAFERKMNHLDKEKERRLRQTKCYEFLRHLVPFLDDVKTDKASVLETTVAYLSHIRETLGPRMENMDKSFLENVEQKQDLLS